jgi:hypothetical protein
VIFSYKKRSILFNGAIAILAVVVAVTLGMRESQKQYYKTSIPNKIKIDQTYFIDTKDFELGDLLLGGSCGLAIFHLSEETVAQIESQRLAFFADARSASPRRWLVGKEATVSYGEWKATPVPGIATNGLSPSFGTFCTTEPAPGFFRQILSHLQQPGSFYTSDSDGHGLIVIPKMNIVIFEFFDN